MATVNIKPGQDIENTQNAGRGTVLEVHTTMEGEFRGMEVEWHTPHYGRTRYRTSAAGDAHTMSFFLLIHKRPRS